MVERGKLFDLCQVRSTNFKKKGEHNLCFLIWHN